MLLIAYLHFYLFALCLFLFALCLFLFICPLHFYLPFAYFYLPFAYFYLPFAYFLLMKQSNIQQLLITNHTTFLGTIGSLADTDYLLSKNGKWTAGQQLEHIRRSVQPVTLAFGLPAWVLKLLFGKANRPSSSYDALVEKYQQKLAAGYSASRRFLPPTIGLAAREKLIAAIEKLVRQLNQRLMKYSEQELDTLLLPHPLLGKLTLREMLYFTAYHAAHHRKATEHNLEMTDYDSKN